MLTGRSAEIVKLSVKFETVELPLPVMILKRIRLEWKPSRMVSLNAATRIVWNALQLPLLPGLSRAAALAELDPAGDAARFLATRLVRERNRVVDALRSAAVEADRLVREGGLG